MKKTIISLVISIFLLSLNAFADGKDGVKPLGNNPTEAQKKVVRDAAKDSCESEEDDNKIEECVADYYAQHNLEEEPDCD